MRRGAGAVSSFGTCIHCLCLSSDLTRDHVFPRSWYPDSTPPNIQHWTVPSCRECNAKHGRNEEGLLLRIGLCVGPEEFAAQGVSAKALRAIKPELARNEKDRVSRARRRQEILNDLVVHDVPHSNDVLPNFGVQSGLEYGGDLLAISISGERLRMLGEKIVRGVDYVLKGKLFQKDQTIEVVLKENEEIFKVVKIIRTKGKSFHLGPGISVSRVEAFDDPKTILFHIEIWGRLKMNIMVLPVGPNDGEGGM
jgi:hypothetical protein